MRKLLNSLFVLTPESYLALEGENILVLNGEETLARYPLHTLQGILYFGYKGASPALMGKCAELQIGLCFFTPNGRFLARSCGEIQGNVVLRKAQYTASDDLFISCRMARSFLAGKLYNSRWVLERATRDHALRLDVKRLKTVSANLARTAEQAMECTSYQELLGLEGQAAAHYFEVFDQLILQNKQDFRFNGRNRRPPTDPVNALLSFLYILLAHDCASALEGAGLDSYVGFLHRDKPGRASLALDLMEELRAPLADRLALTLINTKVLIGKDFVKTESGAVRLTDGARRAVLSAWQERKREEITHPFLGEKLAWGLVPHVQALLLARTLRGDLDTYPPFFWK